MVFGRSKRNSGDSSAIVDFWTWWPTVRADVEAAIASGDWAVLTPQFSRRVQDIHPGLEWEFARGTDARHALVVSAAGVAELRPVAARWGAAAPPADSTWEYHTARQPDPDILSNTIGLGDGVQLDLTQLRFAFRREEDSPELSVVAYHPGFRILNDEARGRVTFLTLDWLLGENGVEEWIGDIAWESTPPPGAAEPRELAAAVAALREEHRTPQWVLLRAELPDGCPLIATVQRPLRPVRWPRFDTHVAVSLPYQHQNSAGLPEAESLAALREFEDTALTTAAGPDGVLLAHETSKGTRTLHYYVDADSPAADDLAEAAGWWKDGRARVERHFDPSLERIGRLR
ncbi:DUF695 domain-containing protein [Dactylosporangium vinaceum]|uniref:DUF695 domain-containing protein n=1 Tax=Dactylosporangium vinaceum TaxID=53362 RepID=A0ABV5LZN6_9ACTN|nr:DUF695 domain-containing protein [Dactylosporangium vinaceum]UAB94702.1 DUF695 domain-containing protein [Dactylosporangium vinaceum]